MKVLNISSLRAVVFLLSDKTAERGSYFGENREEMGSVHIGI